MNDRAFIGKVALLLFITSPLYAKPRISLAHFEKDLQSMSKQSKNMTIKAGSFIDCLSDKRRKKEIIEQEIAVFQQEVDVLSKEVAQQEITARELIVSVAEQKNRLQQRTHDMQDMVLQLAQAHDALYSSSPRDV